MTSKMLIKLTRNELFKAAESGFIVKKNSKNELVATFPSKGEKVIISTKNR